VLEKWGVKKRLVLEKLLLRKVSARRVSAKKVQERKCKGRYVPRSNTHVVCHKGTVRIQVASPRPHGALGSLTARLAEVLEKFPASGSAKPSAKNLHPICPPNHPKMVQDTHQNGPKGSPNEVLGGSWAALGVFWRAFGPTCATSGGLGRRPGRKETLRHEKVVPKWSQRGPKIDKHIDQKCAVFLHGFGLRFFTHVGPKSMPTPDQVGTQIDQKLFQFEKAEIAADIQIYKAQTRFLRFGASIL
jgi:hypothetical protein